MGNRVEVDTAGMLEAQLEVCEDRLKLHMEQIEELAGRMAEFEKAIDLAWVHAMAAQLAAQVDTYARQVRALTERFDTLEREAAAAAGAGAAEPREGA